MMKTAKPHIDPLRTYFLIFTALMLLLIATVWASSYDLGKTNIAIAMGIAVAKALLVILFFMHVRHAGKVVWIFAGAAFVWLALLLGLTMTDYASRSSGPATSAQPNQTKLVDQVPAAAPIASLAKAS
jgi:cytochrome c oxidase subunit 4